MTTSRWLALTMALLAVVATSEAHAAQISDESCIETDGATGCEVGICDVTGAFPGSKCSGGLCKCITEAECLTDALCRSEAPICDTTKWTCAANEDTGSGGDAPASGGGCSTSTGSLSAFGTLLALTVRRRLARKS